VEHLPFEDQTFDYVISVEVIRYLADTRHAIREFQRVLRPGCLALVMAIPPLSLTGYPLLNRLTSRFQVRRFSKSASFSTLSGS